MADVKMGTKIEGAAAQSLDPARKVVFVAKPDPEVEGQAISGSGYLQCPWCLNLGRVSDTERLDSQYYACSACGNPFRG